MPEVYQQVQGIYTGPRGVVVDLPCQFNTQTTIATFQIATGSGLLHTLTIDPVATGTILLNDNVGAGGPVMFQSVALVAGNPFTLIFDTLFANGLFLTIAVAASSVTTAFRQK